MNLLRIHSRRGAQAFTMVEIAIALGVIGFALVAIVGVLPTGLKAQRDNREETIINQDASYFIEAIRSGAQGAFYPSNSIYLDRIRVERNGVEVVNLASADFHTLPNISRNLMGLLSTPTTITDVRTNWVVTEAHLRALSGAVIEKGPVNDNVAFRYRMRTQLVPVTSVSTQQSLGLYGATNIPYLPPDERNDRVRQAINIMTNLYELRLTFAWPLRENGTVGQGRQVFRTLLSGSITNDTVNGGWFFTPSLFTPAMIP